jgi:hypothetical protein
MIRAFEDWFISLGWQAAALFLLAVFIGVLMLTLLIDTWWQGREKRAIRRRRRQNRIKARELQRYPQAQCSPRISAAFLRALNLQKYIARRGE